MSVSGKTVAGTVTVRHNVTEEDVHYILDAAFGGDSQFWVDHLEVAVDKDDTDYPSEAVAKGGLIRIFVDEEEGHRVFGLSDFIRGFQKYLEWGFAKGRAVYTDAGSLDACEADIILQFAVFGEIVYN